MAEIITEECHLPLTPDEFVAELDTELKPMLPTAQLKPGIERLIQHLAEHNVPVAIATSSRRRTGKMKMSGHTDLFNLFSHKVFGSDDPEVGKGKPNPDIFLVAAKRFQDQPSPGRIIKFWLFIVLIVNKTRKETVSNLVNLATQPVNLWHGISLISCFRKLSGIRGQHFRSSGCTRSRHAG